MVLLGTENRQNMLGHLALLGARRPVLPMASGGAPEGRVGAAVVELLADWADRCHADGGLVVGAHFPLPLAEIAADIVAGRIDAIEMQTFAPGLDNPTVLEWYRFLNCGYRLPVLGGTDKMSAEMAARRRSGRTPDSSPASRRRSRPGPPRCGPGGRRRPRARSSSSRSTATSRATSFASRRRADGSRCESRARAAQPIIGVVELVMNGRVVAAEDGARPGRSARPGDHDRCRRRRVDRGAGAEPVRDRLGLPDEHGRPHLARVRRGRPIDRSSWPTTRRPSVRSSTGPRDGSGRWPTITDPAVAPAHGRAHRSECRPCSEDAPPAIHPEVRRREDRPRSVHAPRPPVRRGLPDRGRDRL